MKKILIISLLFTSLFSSSLFAKNNNCETFLQKSIDNEEKSLRNVRNRGSSNPVVRSSTFATLALLNFQKYTFCIENNDKIIDNEEEEK